MGGFFVGQIVTVCDGTTGLKSRSMIQAWRLLPLGFQPQVFEEFRGA